MDVPLIRLTSYRIESIDTPLSRLARRTLLLGTTLALCLCVVAVIRGLLGVFKAPESAVLLVIAAVAAEALASGFRVVWLWLYPRATRASILFVRLGIPSIGLICVASAISMAQASGWVIGSLWFVVVGGELAWWIPKLWVSRQHSSEHRAIVALNRDEAETAGEKSIDDQEKLAANVVQRMTRFRNDDGVEVISGILRAEFVPGERTHNLHIAFCPPLAYEPEVIARQLDGEPLTVKVAQSEVFGARIELQLAAAAKPSERAAFCFEVQPR